MPGTVPIHTLDDVPIGDFQRLYALAIEITEAKREAMKGVR